MKDALAPFSKAIAGAFGTIVVSLGTAMSDGNLTGSEVIVAVGAGLVIGGGLVYAAPKNAE